MTKTDTSTARRSTVRDVAREAGVDPSIVSRVLNGEPRRVREETRDRIYAAAEKLEYRPNALARGLSMGRTLTLGVLAPSLTNPGYTEMLAGIERGAAKYDYVLLHASTHDDDAAMLKQIARFEGRVDGIITASARRGSQAMLALEASRIPFLLVNRAGSDEHVSVVGDDAEGARLATAHLISLGHRRIGYVNGPHDLDTLVRRLAGYHEAMRLARLAIDPQWTVETGVTEQDGGAATRQLLALDDEKRPTAIFYSTVSLALGGAEAARELRFSVPDQLSIVSFDDSPLLRHLVVPFTAVRMPDNEMGLHAVDLLHDVIEGRVVPRHTLIAKPPELVVRQSTRSPRD
ncbi:MAG: LacI family DNA-binding transcriptional regulator [Devosia sp.]